MVEEGLNSLSVSSLLHSARAPKCDSLVDIEVENIFVNFRQIRRFRLSERGGGGGGGGASM